MRRTLLMSVLPFVSAFLGGLLALNLGPRPVEAQDAHLRGEQLTLVGANGAERILLNPGPGIGASIQVLDADGARRVQLSSGQPTATGSGNPDAGGLLMYAGDGTTLARLGSNNTSPSTTDGMHMYLNDQQGTRRIELLVAGDGTPSIELRDATGAVIWSAP
jgi:hypothetical protein